MKRIITFALTLLLLASAFCVEAFAAPKFIYTDSTTKSGTYKNAWWNAKLEIYGSQTATATFDSEFKGLVGVSLTAKAYRKNQGTIDKANPTKLSTGDGIINNSNNTQRVTVRLYAPNGNLANPILYATANYKNKNYTVKTLELDYFK